MAELIHVPNTWHTEVAGPLGPDALRAELWRQGVLLQLGRGGERSGDQAGPAPRAGRTATRSSRSAAAFTAGPTAPPAPRPSRNTTKASARCLAGFRYAPYGDLGRRGRSSIDDETVRDPGRADPRRRRHPHSARRFPAGLRELADEHELLLIFDEVQTGCGRTGKWFAYQHFGVTPDIMTLAKSLCGGIAGAALLTTAEIAPSLRPGMHAATFGGNPIAARAGIATIETIEEDRPARAGHAAGRAVSPAARHRWSTNWRSSRSCACAALMIGLELAVDGAPIVERCLERGLLGQLHAADGDPAAAGDDAHRRATRRRLRHPGRRAAKLYAARSQALSRVRSAISCDT